MRILHVHTRYRHAGGEDTVVAAERELLTRAGVDLIPLDFENPESPVAAGAALLQAPSNRKSVGRVVLEASRNRVDVVHVHNTWFALSPSVVSKLDTAGFPVVMTFHNYRLLCVNAMLFRSGAPCQTCVGRSPWPGFLHRCYRGSSTASGVVALTIDLHRRRRTWDHLAAALVLTEFARRLLVLGGLPRERTRVKPNFVADPGPRPVPPSGSQEVLYVGRLSPEKGVAELLEAWQRLQPSDLELVVVGSGPEEERLRRHVGPGVRFVGRLAHAEVRQRMLRARGLAFPTKWFEGQPMVLLEALACGLPVFTTDHGALLDTAAEGGVSMGRGTGEEIAQALAILADGTRMDELGLAARARYEAEFTEERSLAALLDVYEGARQ